MKKEKRGAAQTPKKDRGSRGALLFKTHLGAESCATVAAALSKLLPAGAEAFKRETVWCYANGVRRPSLDRALVIERWSEGAVPVAAWAEAAEASRGDARRATVARTRLGVLP